MAGITPIPFVSTPIALSSRDRLRRPLTAREMDLLFYSMRFGNYLNDITFNSATISGNDIFIDFLRVDSLDLSSIDMTVDSTVFSVVCTLSSRSRLDFITDSYGLNFTLNFKVNANSFLIESVDNDTSDTFVVEFLYRIDDITGEYIFSSKITEASVLSNDKFLDGFLFTCVQTTLFPVLFDCSLSTTLVPSGTPT